MPHRHSLFECKIVKTEAISFPLNLVSSYLTRIMKSYDDHLRKDALTFQNNNFSNLLKIELS